MARLLGGEQNVLMTRSAEFAMEYADQNELDYRAFVTAIKEGRIEAAADV